MEDELTEMYCNWLDEQNLAEAWEYEAKQAFLKEAELFNISSETQSVSSGSSP
jgi:hypothetical protein